MIDRRIIDVHVHVYARDDRWQTRTPNPVTGAALTALDERSHRAAILDVMHARDVTTAVLLDVAQDPSLVRRWMESTDRRFVGGFGFDSPNEVTPDWLRARHDEGILGVIGEVGAAYAGLALNDPSLDPYYALAEELDVPIAIHGGSSGGGAAYRGYPGYRMDLVDPLLLEDVLIRHPALRIWLMHAGWPFGDRTLALLHAHRHVYVDVGVICWTQPRSEFLRYLELLVRAGFGDRIMFGSDAMVWTDAISVAIDALESASFLSEQQLDDIFYGNAARFLRLEQ